jgi:hypothetical protein
MPRGPHGQKRPADAVGCAVTVAQIATGEISETPKTARMPSKRTGGVAGGKARAKALSPERRKEIARAAAEARWEIWKNNA